MGNPWDRTVIRTPHIGVLSPSAKQTLALASNYSYGVGGAALGLRFIAPTAANITDVWWFANTITGTPGSTLVEVRDYNAVSNARPGANLLGSQSVSPGAVNGKWINAHLSTPVATVIDTLYWVVIGDPAGSAGNNVTIASRSSLGAEDGMNLALNGFTTANGYTTDGTQVIIPPIITKWDNGTLLGAPFTTTGSYGSNTRERGIKLTGLTEQLTISGLIGIPTACTAVNIYKGTGAPGSAKDLVVTLTAGAIVSTVARFLYTFQKDTVYRVTLVYGSSTITPATLFIEDSATTTDTTNCGILGGGAFSTIDNGAGGWTDDPSQFPDLSMLIHDQVSISGGSVGILPARGRL